MRHKRTHPAARGVALLFFWAVTISNAADAERWHVVDPKTPAGLRELFSFNGEPIPMVDAHRGGARKGFPENCIATFEDTLRSTHAMMEVDPRITRDGKIVLHHDATLERTTNGSGRVSDFTVEELKRLRLKDPDGNLTEFSMPTLDEALAWAKGKTILVLDQKDVPVEARVRKIEEHDAEAFALLIVYSFEDARRCHEMNKNIMMEVMIPNREKFEAFDRLGIPWSHIIAFVGHNPPKDPGLLELIHGKGAICVAGTSRNLDRRLMEGLAGEVGLIEAEYRALLERGVDLIETDLPREAGRLLYKDTVVPESRSKYLIMLNL